MSLQNPDLEESNTILTDGKMKCSGEIMSDQTSKSEQPFLGKNASGQRKRIVRQSTFLAVGAIGIFAAFSGVMCLQSSLNFDDSLGTTSLSLCYVTTIFMNATLVPLLLQVFGAKFLLLVGDAAFTVFTFANIYPTKWTMYSGAVILGIAESIVWPSFITFNTRFGFLSAISGEKDTDASSKRNKHDVANTVIWTETRWFSGRFFAIFAVHQIIGNLISYAILVFDYIDEDANEESRQNITETSPNFCGANDCYNYGNDANSTSQRENLDVKNGSLRYGLFAAYALIQICSFVLHKVLLDETHVNHNLNLSLFSFKTIRNYQWRIWRHMTSPLQVLLSPINIYTGMTMGFIFGDVTRSFVSCPIGVEQVGLTIAVTGVVAVFGSILFQRLSGMIGRFAFVVIAMVMDVSLFVLCLYWEPSNGRNSWQIYFFVPLFGFPDSIKQAALAATYPEYFVGKESVAFSMMSLCSAIGMAIMFGFGTLMCVRTKIIILLALGALSGLCYCGAELYFRRMKRKKGSLGEENGNPY